MWGNSGAAGVPVIIDDGAGHTLHDLFELVLNAYPVNIFLDHEMNIINITESEMNPTAVNDVIQGMVDNIPSTTCNDPIAINYTNNAICDYTNAFTDYEIDIQPIFDNNCTQCHGSSGGLSLANYTNLMSSSVVTLNNGGASTIYSRMTSSTNSMPPTGLIDSYLSERIKAWIDQGAPECAQGENCAGVCGGLAEIDECGTCDSDPSNDCMQDCALVWGGSLVDDDCGVCPSVPNYIAGSCHDCAGVPNGESLVDECSTCDADTSNDCIKDCAFIWGGTALNDECDDCVEPICNSVGTPSPFNPGMNPCESEEFPTSTLWNTSCLSIQNQIPESFSINNIYPNPFNPVVNINYSLSKSDIVEINIYDLNGQIVEALFSGYKPIGTYDIAWDASNMSSGIYIIMIKSGNVILSNQLILLK
jgi:cytochrome c5